MEAKSCDKCGGDIYFFKSKRTGKFYACDDPEDHRSFHKCDGDGGDQSERPSSRDNLRKTGWIVNPTLTKEAWLQDVLNKACAACQAGTLDIMKINPAVRDAFAKLLADAKAAASDVAAGEIPF